MQKPQTDEKTNMFYIKKCTQEQFCIVLPVFFALLGLENLSGRQRGPGQFTRRLASWVRTLLAKLSYGKTPIENNANLCNDLPPWTVFQTAIENGLHGKEFWRTSCAQKHQNNRHLLLTTLLWMSTPQKNIRKLLLIGVKFKTNCKKNIWKTTTTLSFNRFSY